MQIDVGRRQPLGPALELSALIWMNVVQPEDRLVTVLAGLGRGRRRVQLTVRVENKGRFFSEPEKKNIFFNILNFFGSLFG